MGKQQTILPIPVPIIQDEQGRFLFVFKEKALSKACIEHWQLPGGKMNFGESVKDAIVRKVKEYLSLDIEPLQILPYVPTLVSDDSNGEYQFIKIPITAKIVRGTIVPKRGKIKEARWFTYQELVDLQQQRLLIEKDLEVVDIARQIKKQT